MLEPADYLLERLVAAYSNYRRLSLYEWITATKHERALRAVLYFEIRSISAHIEAKAFDAPTRNTFLQWLRVVEAYALSWAKE